MAACEELGPGCRGSDSGGGGGFVCVNLGQQCLTCKQEQKDIPAHTHLHVQRKNTDAQFNMNFSSRELHCRYCNEATVYRQKGEKTFTSVNSCSALRSGYT